MFPGDRADVVAVCIDNAAHRIELPLDLGILHPVSQGLRLAVDRDGLDGHGFAAEPVEHRRSPSCPADQARTRSGVTRGERATPGTKEIRERRRVCRVDRRDDLDMGGYEVGNLRFQAKNLIFRAGRRFFQRKTSSPHSRAVPAASVLAPPIRCPAVATGTWKPAITPA